MSQNLLYTNSNPNPNNICDLCRPNIGKVFAPGNEIPVPVHPGCYCTYYPTFDKPTEIIDWPRHWSDMKQDDPETYRKWVQNVAWRLREGMLPLPLSLQPLRADAEAYNENEYEPREGESQEETMSFTHDSKIADADPTWSDVDKTRLPNAAFADREDRKYPHHWVEDGGDRDDSGHYTTGTMYLHKDGLDAAWSAAQGARSGQKAPAPIITHLEAHRKALGLDDEETTSGVSAGHTRMQTTTGRVLLQPTTADRREYECVFMQAGRVKQSDQEQSNWLIPADTIRIAAPMFSSVPCYLDHPEMFGFGWHQSPQIKNLAGITFDAHWSETKNAVIGRIRLYDKRPDSPGAIVSALMDQILADRAAGLEVPKVGLSAVIFKEDFFDEEAGLTVTKAISYVESVDFVYDAGAGGYIRAALAAIQPQRQWQGLTVIGGNTMPGNDNTPIVNSDPLVLQPAGPPTTAEILATTQTVAAQLEALTAQVSTLSTPAPAPPETVTPSPNTERLDALTAQVETLTQALAASEETDTIVGMGQATHLSGARSSLDQLESAFDAMVTGVRPPNNVQPLTGIREMYHLLSGDFEMTGVYNPDRVYLANVNCSTMAGLVANRMNKRVVNLFQEYPKWWEKAVTPEDFATLQDVRWITLGGIGELPTVKEGAVYTELTWDDQTETDAFIKKGGYLGLTIEAIDKDDTRKLQAAPRALAQSAWLTLGKAIAAIFTDASGTGPTMSDSNVLFDASNHGNLLTAALSSAAWKAVKIAMQKQGELNSDERLGALTYPKLLWVPIDKEDLGLQILATQQDPGSGDWNVNVNAEGNERETRLSNARNRLITCPLWTNTDNWAAQADPLLYPSIGLGFRYGRTPEVVSVASPTAGLMFTNDVMPIKVRFFFAVGPIDWRGLHKNNV